MEHNPHIKLGLALGGGGVLGAAHLGILQALEEHDLKPDLLTGTSAGAAVAALYGFGHSPHTISEEINEIDWWDISNFAWSKHGLMNNAEMGNFLRRLIDDASFDEANLPLAFIATDICSGHKVVLDQGSVAEAAMISACIPGLYTPYERGEHLLVDGGLVENVPVSPLRDMGADFILAIDLNGSTRHRRPESMIDVLVNAFDIAIDSHTHAQLQTADYVLSLDLADFSRTTPGQAEALFTEGYRACLREIEQIQQAVAARSPSVLQRITRSLKDISR